MPNYSHKLLTSKHFIHCLVSLVIKIFGFKNLRLYNESISIMNKVSYTEQPTKEAVRHLRIFLFGFYTENFLNALGEFFCFYAVYPIYL